MKNAYLFLIGLLFCSSVTAQINSNNILEYYEQVKSTETYTHQNLILVAQIGNNNMVEVEDHNPDFLAIVQNGDVNTTYYQNYSEYRTNMEINVYGSGNYVEIEGANSISDGMKINIKADDMTFLMRNQ